MVQVENIPSGGVGMILKRKNNKVDDLGVDQAKFKNFVCTTFGYTDETFKNLFLVFWAEVVFTRPLAEYVDALTRLSSTEYFYKVGRKQAAYAAFCLMLADALVDKSHPEFVLNANNHRALLLAATYYRLISKSVAGYTWLCQNETISHDAWLYIKAGCGQFAYVITGDVLHVEHQVEDNVSEFDLKGIGGFNTEVPVPAIFNSVAAVGSDQDVLSAFSANSENSTVNADDIKADDKPPSFADFMS